MKRTTLSEEVVNLQSDAIASLLDNGYLRVYSGLQPSSPDSPLGTQVMLAELRFNMDAFMPSINGVATANPIQDAIIAQTGTASFFRAFKADGVTAVYDGTVGTTNANMIIAMTNLQQGIFLGVQQLTFTSLKEATGY